MSFERDIFSEDEEKVQGAHFQQPSPDEAQAEKLTEESFVDLEDSESLESSSLEDFVDEASQMNESYDAALESGEISDLEELALAHAAATAQAQADAEAKQAEEVVDDDLRQIDAEDAELLRGAGQAEDSATLEEAAVEPALLDPQEPNSVEKTKQAQEPSEPDSELLALSFVGRSQPHNTESGSTTSLSWGARTDVGLVRDHNEDSFFVKAPLFCVCDGMGGHEAGEVASSIATKTIVDKAPDHADDSLLGEAVEAANLAVIKAAQAGIGQVGMGCTATTVLLEDSRIAIAHVGDSRVYILHAGNLVRVTHDHSVVEELVDAGIITADQARVHPERSQITRALGSDPEMYADHFVLDVQKGDRIILCSDGLSCMITDAHIESIALSTPQAQKAADELTGAALAAGGNDNITVIVVDVVDDGREEALRKARFRAISSWIGTLLAIVLVFTLGLALLINNSWYLGNDLGNVAIYHGINARIFGIQLSELAETSTVEIDDLPQTTQRRIAEGISIESLDQARATIASYQQQIKEEQRKADQAAQQSQKQSNDPQAAAPVHDHDDLLAQPSQSTPIVAERDTTPAADDPNVQERGR